MTKKVLVLPGDGIGKEIIAEAQKIIDFLNKNGAVSIETEVAALGGAGYEQHGKPLPDETVSMAHAADAVLLGAVGGPAYDTLPRELRPERGLLGIRAELGLFANLRPATLLPQLASASTLKTEVVSGLDIMIVRELTGGIYFGGPRGIETRDGETVGINTMVYSRSEVARIAKVALDIASKRNGKLCSVDKANVLECSELWRETVIETAADYADVELSHMYVDNAAMQLVRDPKQFDVMVTGNLFGDILSDCASMLTGSLGMLPSASLDINGKGLYEPVHGSAPDIMGQNKANPLATILSLAMMLRYTLGYPDVADAIDAAISDVLEAGYRTGDIHVTGTELLGTTQMGEKVLDALSKRLS